MACLATAHFALHALLLVLRILFLVPLALYYTVCRNRPHPRFTLHQALARRLMFDLMQFYTSVRLVTPMPADDKRLGARYISMTPSSSPAAYEGPLQDEVIKPAVVRGIWYPDVPSPSSLSALAKKHNVLLHFHGGGYVLGSPFPLDSGHMAGLFTRHITPITLLVGYRLTCTPNGRFPAPLQDAVTSYLHLLDQGVPAENIILSGDSAGGHLVISLLRYVKEHLPNVFSPKAAILWSPWINVAAATPASHVIRRKNYATDYLPAEFAAWAAESLAPEGIIDRSGPYITLRGQIFKTSTKLWAHVGDLELLYDEVKEWVHDMRNAGNSATLMVEPGAPHDIMESGHINGYRKEGEKAVQAAAAWLKQTSE